MRAKLYGLPGAPPSYAAELMLRHKGVEYRRVNLLPGWHRRTLRSKGFPGGTCPALELDGRLVQTNRAIARALDALVPEPPLFPSHPGSRAEVEEVEAFTDEILQHAVRRMTLWALTHDYDSISFHPAMGKLSFPRNRILRSLLIPRVFAYYGVSEQVIREHHEALPEWLDRLDACVLEGVIDNGHLTAADFQLAPLVAMLLGHRDLRPRIEQRPIAGLVRHVLGREALAARTATPAFALK